MCTTLKTLNSNYQSLSMIAFTVFLISPNNFLPLSFWSQSNFHNHSKKTIEQHFSHFTHKNVFHRNNTDDDDINCLLQSKVSLTTKSKELCRGYNSITR